MFRTTCTITLALAVLASTAEGQSDQDSRIGFGVRLNPVAIGDIDVDSSVLPTGLGNFTVPIRLGENLRLGPELGTAPRPGSSVNRRSPESSGSPTFETKRTDNYFGLAVGGEYWFAPRFSLGAEVQINRVGMGDEEVTPPPGSSTNVASSLISNNGIIAVRFYL